MQVAINGNVDANRIFNRKIEQSKLWHSDYLSNSCDLTNVLIKFEYLQHSSQNRYETSMSKSEIDRLCPLFQIYQNYYWVLFEMPSVITVRMYDVILRWTIEVKYLDVQPIEIIKYSQLYKIPLIIHI